MLLSFVTTTAFANFESTFAQFLSLRLGTGPSTVAWFFVFVGVCSVVVQGGLVRPPRRRASARRASSWRAASS